MWDWTQAQWVQKIMILIIRPVASLAKWCDHTPALVCSPDGTPWYPAASWDRELRRREMDRTQM